MRFHLLSFEGCDAYARAGGIATRVSGLIETRHLLPTLEIEA
jgi:hypothetical protein